MEEELHSSSSLDEREVDVLERRPAHLEPLELLAARERVGRQLVQHARRLARAHEDLLAVAAVADLDLEVAPT